MLPELFRASFRSFRGRPAVHPAGRLSGVGLIMSRRKGGPRKGTFGDPAEGWNGHCDLDRLHTADRVGRLEGRRVRSLAPRSGKGNEKPPPTIIELPSGERGNPEQES